MRRILAGILTVLIGAGLLWSGLQRGGGTPGADVSAEAVSSPILAPDPLAGASERLDGLMAAARSGAVDSYLDAFAEPVRSRLRREVQEKGAEAFAAELRRAAQTRKSHAVFAPEADGPDAARMTVESVYPDHNERQTYRLERQPEGWRITEVEIVRSHTPAAKYGEPAYYLAPEAPPVPLPPGSREPVAKD